MRSQDVWLPIMVSGCLLMVVWLIAHALGGWRLLAKRYRAKHTPTGDESIFETVYINGGRYLWMRLVTNSEGLFMEVPFFFRLGHPPLLIPWTDITKASSHNYIFWKWVVLEVGNPRIATIRLSPNVFQGSVEGRARLEEILNRSDVTNLTSVN